MNDEEREEQSLLSVTLMLLSTVRYQPHKCAANSSSRFFSLHLNIPDWLVMFADDLDRIRSLGGVPHTHLSVTTR